MRNIISLVTVIISTLLLSCNNSNKNKFDEFKMYGQEQAKERPQSFSRDTTKFDEGAAYYQCPEHPEVVSGRPGYCPKCNSELEYHEKY